MLIATATMRSFPEGSTWWEGPQDEWMPRTWRHLACQEHRWWIQTNAEVNLGVVASWQAVYKGSTPDDRILMFAHDDLEIFEQDWDLRVLREFRNPDVGLVGFGGALAHGDPDLYKRPYRLQQLARRGYVSNTRDAEQHGAHMTGSCEVAVLDGFCMIVRRDLLDRCGGFHPELWPPHHIYDYVLSAEARRWGYKIRVVGVDCVHYGGQTATSRAYLEWAAKTKWGSDEKMHEEGHRLYYERYRDVMPWRVRG